MFIFPCTKFVLQTFQFPLKYFKSDKFVQVIFPGLQFLFFDNQKYRNNSVYTDNQIIQNCLNFAEKCVDGEYIDHFWKILHKNSIPDFNTRIQ